MPKKVTETYAVSERSASQARTSGRMRVQAISAGLGSSGLYSADVLREAADNRLIAEGCPLYLDHPTATDRADRPERSVRDIAGVFTADATYDETAEALVGEIQVFAPYRELLTEMAPYIGLSITGSATDVTEGEYQGKRVPVVEGLAAIDSVDWVTKAGRGGKVLQLLESARGRVAEASVSDAAWSDFKASDYDDAQWKRACLLDKGDEDATAKDRYGLPVKQPDGTLNRNGCHAAASVLGGGRGGVKASDEAKTKAAKKLVGIYRNQLDEDPPASLLTAAGMKSEESADVAEATASERGQQLATAIRAAHPHSWLRDMDAERRVAWFTTYDGDDVERTWQQGYTIARDDTAVELTGEPVEVRPLTKYVPVTQASTATTSAPVTRPGSTTTATESQEDTVGKIQIEEAEHSRLVETAGRVDELTAERDRLLNERADRRRRDAARGVIEASDAVFTALEVRGLLADLPVLTEGESAGDLDVEAFTTTVTEAAASKAQTSGTGRVVGHGVTEAAGSGTVTTPAPNAWGRTEQKGA